MLVPMAFILGIDEAGRGPLAGPVAVGVVKAPEGFDLLAAFPGLNDSKKLTETKREKLYALLQEHIAEGTLEAVVCFSSETLIDERGISYAVKSALARGVRKLMPDPAGGKVYLDGSLKAPAGYEQETVIGGDALIPAIMLASVAAKVTRDRLMKKLAEAHPLYGFEKHKGYGTQAHYAALAEHGPCAIHRATYLHLDPAS